MLTRHRGMNKAEARAEAASLLDRVGIPDPERRLKDYPHQLSGGHAAARADRDGAGLPAARC